MSLGQVLFRQNNQIKSMTDNSVSAEDVAKVLWQDFLPFFYLAKPFPKTVFGSLVLGASPLTDVPGTVHSFNRVYQLGCTNTSYVPQ